jgi:AraC family transcriptional regulator of adaptative response/methylated-DNA-[protein]-cysteine methyltransferase
MNHYSFHPTPFGEILVAIINNTICYLAFVDTSHAAALAELHKQVPGTYQNAQNQCIPLVNDFFTQPNHGKNIADNLTLHGTHFQITVWRELLNIPFGTTVSYSEIANRIGKPTATRAVAHAIACNKIAFFVPCHRVIRKSGDIHRYRWASERKKAILAWEKQQ